jgi:TonB family protein
MKLIAIIAAHSGLVFAHSITQPEILRRPEPEYTAAARAKRVEGVVSLAVVVNAEGVPENIKIVRSLNADLDACAVRAVEQWRFKPAKKDGIPVSVSAIIDVQVRLPRYPIFPSASGRPQEAPPIETADTDFDWWDIFR